MIDVRTLRDGGQPPAGVAEALAAFFDGATRSLDIAIYDLHLSPDLARRVVGAIAAARQRSVAVRLIHAVQPAGRGAGPPPPRTDADLVAACACDVKAFPAEPFLMHQKYAIADGDAVWTGSTNWSDDSWSREENVIVVIRAAAVAAAYAADFGQLWTRGAVDGTGDVDVPPIAVGGATVRAWFTPGRARSLVHRIANAIGAARRRVRVASPVITSGPILGTLEEVAADGRVDLTGVVDATQIEEVLGQWATQGQARWKSVALRSLLARGRFSGKRSTPWAPGTTHDFMHAKMTVVDDTVFVGSFNLSHAGEENAENVVEIADPALAERMAAYIDAVRGSYPAWVSPPR